MFVVPARLNTSGSLKHLALGFLVMPSRQVASYGDLLVARIVLIP